MKTETERKLKNLEKHLKTCPDCGKEFLGIAIDGGVNPAHTWQAVSEISLYPLKCGKCPNCAEKCFDKIDDFCSEKINKENYNNRTKIPCLDELWTSEEWENHNFECIDCYFYFDLGIDSGREIDDSVATYLFDLLEFFKEPDKLYKKE